MDLRQSEIGLLIALDALLDCESVTAAARRLGVSQPAMSAQLARLRRMFDDPLLVPSGRKLTPTARALGLKAPLRALLADLDMLVRERARFDPARADRTFRIIGADYVHGVLAPALYAAMAAAAPRARLALLPLDPASLWRRLEADAADLALATGPAPPDARRRAGLTEGFVVIARRSGPFGAAPLSLDAFCAADHALVSPEGGGFVGAADRALAAIGRTRRVACSLPSFLLAPSLIARSDLLALVPARLAALHEGLVAITAPPFDAPRFSVDLLWHPRRQGDPAHIWLRGLIAETLAALDAGGAQPAPPQTVSGSSG